MLFSEALLVAEEKKNQVLESNLVWANIYSDC